MNYFVIFWPLKCKTKLFETQKVVIFTLFSVQTWKIPLKPWKFIKNFIQNSTKADFLYSHNFIVLTLKTLHEIRKWKRRFAILVINSRQMTRAVKTASTEKNDGISMSQTPPLCPRLSFYWWTMLYCSWALLCTISRNKKSELVNDVNDWTITVSTRSRLFTQ